MLIILVRHGATALNNSAKPSVRGWRDDPLETSSFADVRKTARAIRQYSPQWVTSSDFMRDAQTKMILVDELGIADTEVEYDSRTWDVGTFSGKPEAEVNDAIQELYKRPWDTPPGSLESFNEFSARWQQFLDRKMQKAGIEGMRPGIIVTHGRNLALTDSYFNFKMPEDGLMPYPAGYGILSVANDRSLQYAYPGETECVCVDV